FTRMRSPAGAGKPERNPATMRSGKFFVDLKSPPTRRFRRPQRAGPSGCGRVGRAPEGQRNPFRASPLPLFLPRLPVRAIQIALPLSPQALQFVIVLRQYFPAPPSIIFESGNVSRLPEPVSKRILLPRLSPLPIPQ